MPLLSRPDRLLPTRPIEPAAVPQESPLHGLSGHADNPSRPEPPGRSQAPPPRQHRLCPAGQGCSPGQATRRLRLGAPRPDSQLESTSRCGDRLILSKSYTFNGPSTSCNDEKSGLSARNLPWAATCASQQLSSAVSTRSAVAIPSAMTVASGYRAEIDASSRPPACSPGPPTTTTERRAGACAEMARSHDAAEGFTLTALSCSAGSKPQGTAFRRPCGTTMTASESI